MKNKPFLHVLYKKWDFWEFQHNPEAQKTSLSRLFMDLNFILFYSFTPILQYCHLRNVIAREFIFFSKCTRFGPRGQWVPFKGL